RLTPSSTSIRDAAIARKGEKLYYLAAYEGSPDLWELDLREKSNKKLQKVGGGGSLAWDAKAEDLFILGFGRMSKLKGGKLTPITLRTEMKLDPAAEREYMFHRVYREEKQRFYTEKMHGVEWEALRDNYARFLPHINNNYDFAELLSEWLGELNVSHTGGRYSHPAPQGSAATAELGLLFDQRHAGDGLLVEEVVEKGPFDRAASKVAAGDIVERIDGVPVRRGEDYYPLLDGRAGRKTLVSILRPSDGSRWDEVVEPLSRGAMSQLLYRRWVKQRAADVDRLSGGRLGYVHIESMGDPSFRSVYSDILGKYNDREGIVIDTRFNGGGRLHEDIEVLFSGEKYFTQVIRGKESCDMPSRRWNKPSIMLTGEANYSNAHGTPWVYKHRGLGKLVGMPVPGTMTSVSWE
ncbi:MAG: peptidase S41, partial [Alistipes sp.]|nr:peptidase S41 [Alistipes sp.]